MGDGRSEWDGTIGSPVGERERERERAGYDSALERERANEEERGMTQRERVR